jgi:hypothetical protein
MSCTENFLIRISISFSARFSTFYFGFSDDIGEGALGFAEVPDAGGEEEEGEGV